MLKGIGIPHSLRTSGFSVRVRGIPPVQTLFSGGGGGFESLQGHQFNGKVAEWSIVLAWNASEPKGSQGSNPCLSAKIMLK